MSALGINGAILFWLLAVTAGALVAAGVCVALIPLSREDQDD